MSDSYVTKAQIIRVAMLFLVLALVIKASLMFVSFVHFDTNYYLNIGSNFVERGQLTPYMWRLDADTNIIAGSGTGYGVLLITYWLKIFGVSLLSGYTLMYIIGLFILLLTYFIARMWWRSEIAAWGAVVFMALSWSFMQIFYVRMDAIGILSYSILLLLYIYAIRAEKTSFHFWVGVVAVATAEFHILSILYVIGLSFHYLVTYIQNLKQTKRLSILNPSTYFYFGALIAGIIYLIIHVLPDPQAYFIITQECRVCSPPGLFKEFIRVLQYRDYDPFDILILSIGLGVSLARRSEADNHLLLLFAGCWIGMVVISPPVYGFYTIHLLPIFSLFVGGLFITDNTHQTKLPRQVFRVACSIACVVLLSRIYTYAIYSATPKNYPVGVDYVNDYISQDATVMGHPTIYYRLLEYSNFLSYPDGERYGILLRDEDYQTFWERERPVVYVGYPESDDVTFWTYMNQYDFRRVRDDVWVDGEYYETLVSDVQQPDVIFTASETQVNIGDCLILEWLTEGIDEVRLDEEFVESNGTSTLCPLFSTTYTLYGYWVGGIEQVSIVIEVD